MTGIDFHFTYHCTLARDGVIIDSWFEENIVPNVGLNYIFGAAFTGVTPITSWYVGVQSAAYDCVASDTFATYLAAATEVTTYTSATRVAYTPDTIVAGLVNNSVAPAVFTFNNGGTITIAGAFLSSQSAKSSSSGTLVSAARFSSPRTGIIAGDVLTITCTNTPTTT
jgi:hypothetical protein